ncbi:MAG TPA: PAS domain-containing sensor histidine kinase [Gemmatimonadaceae bacterium]|nr:PAS domain-containing sensor histidine kinase [Gemmatimonadaceae bacterium]
MSEAEYRLLVEYSPVMIWRAGTDAKCDYFNETWLQFVGRTLEQEQGDGWAEGVHADDLDRCVKHYIDHFNRRQPFEMEYRIKRHDGVYRWLFDRGVPFYDEAGTFLGFIGSCVDVEDRRRAQEERERRDAERIAMAHDFEKRILAIVSHDIRNPLNVIQLAARHLETVATEISVVKRDAERVLRSANRIQNIVGDLLDLSREREGQGISVTLANSDLSSLCRQVLDELETTATGRQFHFECEADSTGLWDHNRIIQAIANLASNAVQHGAPGRPISVRVTGDSDYVVVAVHNDGAIPSDLLPIIFDPFRSGGRVTGRGDGLGLGLFIANAIARAHDGSIEVDSDPTRGTTFRLVLPRRPIALVRSAAG